MSYDHALLVQRVSDRLRTNPIVPLKDLSHELHVSPRTIQNAVRDVTRKSLREFRHELLKKDVCRLLSSEVCSIKEVSSALGYHSPRSFARAIRRVSGNTPTELRGRAVRARRSNSNGGARADQRR
jgi:AraC-like DNA-binding protein